MKKVLLAGMFLLAVLAATPMNVQSGEMCNLKVNITGFPNDNGMAKIALYNTEEDYNGTDKPFRDASIKIQGKKAICEFKNIPTGTYSIKVYHDANNNGKLDKNIIGYPLEAYGVSNNAKSKMGPGKYDEAKFTVAGNKAIDIKVD